MRDAFRSGDVVEVRSASEILSTLDDEGALAAMPFMPEMLQYCGGRFVVDRRAARVCDTINYEGSRKLHDTVLLADLRCDGSAHDGCQAECRLFWKDAWLRRVGPEEPPLGGDGEAQAALARLAARNTRRVIEVDGRSTPGYRCQATELFRASERAERFPYAREYTSGNVSFGRFVRVVARAAVQEFRRKLRLVHHVALKGTRTTSAPEPPLDLQAGEWVQVKARAEIAETLSPRGTSRGLWFDREMLPFCGKKYRVRRRVNRFVDDQTGRMIELKSDCVTLEGVVCSGELSLGRWFCPRGIYPYWRESWLRRVEAGPPELPKAPGALASAERAERR